MDVDRYARFSLTKRTMPAQPLDEGASCRTDVKTPHVILRIESVHLALRIISGAPWHLFFCFSLLFVAPSPLDRHPVIFAFPLGSTAILWSAACFMQMARNAPAPPM